LDDRQIYLVGTAHISKESVEDVRKTVQVVEPDTICVELCQPRYKALVERDSWKNMDIFKVIGEKKAVFLLSQLIMTSFYRRLGEKLGIQPGAEMVEAIKQAQQTGAKLVLADRPIEITLKRVWRFLRFWDKLRMFFHLMLGLFESEEVTDELIEKIKQQDQLEAVMSEFAEKFPEIKRRLLDERDIYLSQQIRHSPGEKIVAVVGAGHVEGIKPRLLEDIPVDELLTVPPKPAWPAVVKWAVPAAIIAIIVYGFFKKGAAHSVENIYIWVLVNGTLSAVGALVALGHPLAIASAFLAAPITSLNPLLAAGWVAGVVQAWIRKPKVADLEDLPEAIRTVKGFWTNPVTKILLVVALANLGSVIGTYVAATWITARSL